MRTVVVGMRPRDSQEKSLSYQIKNLYRVKLPVLRLGVITPAEELHVAEADEKPVVDVNMIQPMVALSHVTHASSSKSKRTDWL